jgi:hypothetical protein
MTTNNEKALRAIENDNIIRSWLNSRLLTGTVPTDISWQRRNLIRKKENMRKTSRLARNFSINNS